MPSADRLNLICLPYAGGDGSPYYRWREHLGDRVAVHPAHPPGHGGRFRESPISSMDEMLLSLLAEIPAFAQSPYAILGSSMGAWVGVALSQKILQANLRAPAALFACSASSPYDKIENYRFPNLKGAALVAELHKLHPQLAASRENIELVETMLPVLETDFGLCEHWQPNLSAKLPLPIFGFCGDQDPLVTRKEMERWSLLTDNAYQFHEMPGNHSLVDFPPPAMFARLLEIFRGLPGVR